MRQLKNKEFSQNIFIVSYILENISFYIVGPVDIYIYI